MILCILLSRPSSLSSSAAGYMMLAGTSKPLPQLFSFSEALENRSEGFGDWGFDRHLLS